MIPSPSNSKTTPNTVLQGTATFLTREVSSDRDRH